ncbi:MAG: beta-galactosidase [Gammaproteobacteria bacterium]|jgi:beta-galactosidase|nr:beta-galactosidase [Gammaproteobacteria bacterium]
MHRQLGTCYYPEHWPREQWQQDAQRMAELGLSWVRIGEFSWALIEPNEGELHWHWLDDAIEVLGAAGLKVILGTPTATPPRWMLDKHADMLAWDEQGRPRKFGSRRHYCFSHLGYRQESVRITELMAQRYGNNPHVQAWQTDNEYGCHDTTYSYSPAAAAGFRVWLEQRYGTIDALNEAWGNIFWSMQYQNFQQIELPNLTVTEANPAHCLDFRRYSSDQVVAFNLAQCAMIRRYCKAPISHNYMGRITDFDHFKVAADLDFVTWDSYPLGFLEDRVGANCERQVRYAQQGDPDFQAFHHDLYRAMGKNQDGEPRWWVMEQQPGPVNWAPFNPAPAAGMVRLWSWEAFAHGAEAVCYFRWRQAPFAQEQMHSGMRLPNDQPAQCWQEIEQLAAELKQATQVTNYPAEVALIFDYDAEFAWAVQPHAQASSYFDLVFESYRCLRKLGLSVDIVSPDVAGFDAYKLVLAPGLMTMSESLKHNLLHTSATVLLGPRSGAKQEVMRIPQQLPPAIEGVDLTVTHCESLRPDAPIELRKGGLIKIYREHTRADMDIIEQALDGVPVLLQKGSFFYLAAWLDMDGLVPIVEELCLSLDIDLCPMPRGVRRRQTANECFWFNYGSETQTVDGIELVAGAVVRQT